MSSPHERSDRLYSRTIKDGRLLRPARGVSSFRSRTATIRITGRPSARRLGLGGAGLRNGASAAVDAGLLLRLDEEGLRSGAGRLSGEAGLRSGDAGLRLRSGGAGLRSSARLRSARAPPLRARGDLHRAERQARAAVRECNSTILGDRVSLRSRFAKPHQGADACAQIALAVLRTVYASVAPLAAGTAAGPIASPSPLCQWRDEERWGF